MKHRRAGAIACWWTRWRTCWRTSRAHGLHFSRPVRRLNGEVRRPSATEGRASDAQAQARDAALGTVRQKGHEPQAGYRDRFERSAARGRQGSKETSHVTVDCELSTATL